MAGGFVRGYFVRGVRGPDSACSWIFSTISWELGRPVSGSGRGARPLLSLIDRVELVSCGVWYEYCIFIFQIPVASDMENDEASKEE